MHRTENRSSNRALAAGLCMLSLLAGCQLLEERDQPEEAPEPVVERLPAPEPQPRGDLSTAIDLLQQGRMQRAEALLRQLSGERPGSSTITGLLEQLRSPIEELLPPPYREVVVEPGASLSQIAGDELGDPLMFVALARLNGIEVPASLAVGSTLRIPEPEAAPPEVPRPPEERAARSPDSVADIETVAEYLALSGQPEQARRMLLGLARKGEATEASREMLVQLALEQARTSSEAGRYDRAGSILDETIRALGVSGSDDRLIAERRRIDAESALDRATEAREADRLAEAYAIAQQAASVAGGREEASALAAEIRQQLIDRYHNDALVAWRDRDVDRAIRLWETLLDTVPDFEPAHVYLQRARRLRERLDQP